MSIDSLVAFLIASFLLALSPGPDNLFVLTQSALYGAKRGVAITLGLCTGLIVHTTLVAMGVAALVSTSALTLSVLQTFGAMYLIYLAWLTYSDSTINTLNADNPRYSSATLYRRGVLMNLSNPKVSIFFLAFLPQFVSPQLGSVMGQLFVLGLLFIMIAIVVFFTIAFTAERVGLRLQRSIRAQRVLKRISALIFLALAINLGILNNPLLTS